MLQGTGKKVIGLMMQFDWMEDGVLYNWKKGRDGGSN